MFRLAVAQGGRAAARAHPVGGRSLYLLLRPLRCSGSRYCGDAVFVGGQAGDLRIGVRTARSLSAI